jgi:hypothetical protein
MMVVGPLSSLSLLLQIAVSNLHVFCCRVERGGEKETVGFQWKDASNTKGRETTTTEQRRLMMVLNFFRFSDVLLS